MTRLLAPLASAVVLALAAGAVQAQSHTRPGADVRPFVAIGITGGGDDLESFAFSNGTESTVNAGGIIELRGGVDFKLGGPFSMQVGLGYHFDSAHGSNGDYTFSRTPLEVLGHVAVSQQVRLGAGVRKSFDVHVSSSGVVSGYDTRFDSNTGFVAEVEYFPIQRLGIKLRGVSEKFTARTGGAYTGRFDGSHVGVYASYYFR